MSPSCIRIPKILMPRDGIDLKKWAVIACDQYTSQPEYWEKADAVVGKEPSTLRLTLPEVYLEEADVIDRVADISRTMRRYLREGILREMPEGFILTERHTGGAAPRRGLMVSVDLEAYDYQAGSQSLIRPTEKTVVERIPPRLKVREGAIMELPHIMLLIDAPEDVIGTLFQHTNSYEKLYETDLMLDGGHIEGWFIPKGRLTDAIIYEFEKLGDPELFKLKYSLDEEKPVMPFAVGDGNHSMATAKAYWENIKQGLTPEEQENHPARYALCEVVNIHDASLVIEPIHRVMFGIEPKQLLDEAEKYYKQNGCTCHIAEHAQAEPGAVNFPYYTADGNGYLILHNAKWNLPLAALQAFLDDYLAKNQQAKIDYIHGADVVRELGEKPGNIGFLLPDIEKNDLFKSVIIDGVLPRKTFSMGEAREKRYYMEAKRITED